MFLRICLATVIIAALTAGMSNLIAEEAKTAEPAAEQKDKPATPPADSIKTAPAAEQTDGEAPATVTGPAENKQAAPEGQSAKEDPAKEESLKKELEKQEPGLYAVFETSMGNIIEKLYEKEAPVTVNNFVGLASGIKACKDPKTGEETKGKFYDGQVFHRVIPDFMIQGGDPLGNGTGGPGYNFDDEIDDKLSFDGPGYLAMANRGRNRDGAGTNGSQFFITVAPTPHLDGKHTIFGKVVSGQDVADAISRVKTDLRANRPVEPVVLQHVTIHRIEKKK